MYQMEFSGLEGVTHYMRADRFEALMRTGCLHMRRQDLQEKDSGDGVFPEANKTRMHAFDAHLMRALGQSGERARSLAANYQMGNDQYMRQRHYLHCWTLRDEESKTMWAEHGCGGKGVCIKTTVRRLCEAVGGDRFIGHNGKQFDMKIGRVQYVEEGQPAPTWPSFMIAFCKRARKDFVNEAEARLLACCYDTKHSVLFNCT
jgi:hypothetical protein